MHCKRQLSLRSMREQQIAKALLLSFGHQILIYVHWLCRGSYIYLGHVHCTKMLPLRPKDVTWFTNLLPCSDVCSGHCCCGQKASFLTWAGCHTCSSSAEQSVNIYKYYGYVQPCSWFSVQWVHSGSYCCIFAPVSDWEESYSRFYVLFSIRVHWSEIKSWNSSFLTRSLMSETHQYFKESKILVMPILFTIHLPVWQSFRLVHASSAVL